MTLPENNSNTLQWQRQADVAQDLNAIFAKTRSGSAPQGAISVINPGRQSSRLTVAKVLSVLVLLGLLLCGGLVLAGVSFSSIPRIVDTSIPSGPLQRSAQPPRRASSTDSLGSVPLPIEAASAPPTALLTTPITRPPVTDQHPALMHKEDAAPLPRSLDRRRSTQAATITKPRVHRGNERQSSECAGLEAEERAWCMRPSLLAADRQLLRAYDDARRAGVATTPLTRIQRRWATLQRNAVLNPDETLSGYRGLTGELLQLSSERRSGGRER